MLFTTTILLLMTVGIHSQQEGSPEGWYKTYAVYPEYCSTIEQMENRNIPPLSVEDSLTGGSMLKQVTVLTRHGARAPSGPIQCWDGYLEDPATAVWDCDLTSIKAPLPPSQINQRQGKVVGNTSQFTLDFDVKYDAQADPAGVIVNKLKGSCMAGQLIMRGHEQMKQSGELFRDAYVFNASAPATGGIQDSRLNLIDVSGQDTLYPWDESNLRFRSTDKQRTILSGQTLLQSMYQPEIDAYVAETQLYPSMEVHTADIDNESMLPSFDLCPRLAAAAVAPEETPDVAIAKAAEDTEELIYFIDQVLGGDVDHFEIDCLMTTICSDRKLHDAVNDFTGEDLDEGYFQRLVDMYTNQYVTMFAKNDAEFSKLAMGPLWLEIMTNLQAFVNGDDEICCPTRSPAKLSLYAGHDLTLMPLLASIGLLGKQWVTYAATVVIELHEVGIDGAKDDSIFETNHAFRLMYNGKVSTSEIEGCPPNLDLCDFKVLVELIDSFATNFENCSMPSEESDPALPEEVNNEESTPALPDEDNKDESTLAPTTGGVRGSTSGANEAASLMYPAIVTLCIFVLGITGL